MTESEEEKRMRKLKRDAKDKSAWDDDCDDGPPKGRFGKQPRNRDEGIDE